MPLLVCHGQDSCQSCQQSCRAIRMVEVQSRPSDRDAGGSGAAGQLGTSNIELHHDMPCYITDMPCYITGYTVLIFHADNITPW